MEAEEFLLAMKGLKLPDGRDRLVRHGHGPERTIQTGIGPVEVELQARMEDHGECMLVLIGATPEGKKELIGFQVGVGKVRRAGANFWSR
jgi:hypothetical protein